VTRARPQYFRHPRRPASLAAFFGFFVAAPLAAAEAGGGDSHAVIQNIAVCIVAASVLGLLMRALRQPLILGYLLAGVAIGPLGLALITDRAEITTVAEIGLILLLFMIGLEIDLKRMLAAGRFVVVTGLLQFPLTVVLGLVAFTLASRAGVPLGEGGWPVVYAALAIGLSSTMIVVKLLNQQLELDTLPGRVTVGILVFQDIWAIVLLAVQPSLADPAIGRLAATFGAGALLVVAALLLSRYVLPWVFRSAAKLPELVLVISLGWCFIVALVAAHPRVGLSMEMGALIAGISLATFPYNHDVTAKVTSIRDFFITLFFVALGMQIPLPETGPLVAAAVVALVLVGSRMLTVLAPLYAMGGGQRLSVLAALNLSQLSEFSLVVVSLGVAYGHVGGDVLTVTIWAFALLAVLSTYGITWSHVLERRLARVLTAVGLSDLGRRLEEERLHHARPIALLGFFRVASALIEEIRLRVPHLLDEIVVVDFNPQVRDRLLELGVPVVYGDISHLDTLRHAEVHDAKLILSTVPDAALRGTSNLRLLQALKTLAPEAAVVVTAGSPAHARELYEAGAAYVIQPYTEAAEAALEAVELGLAGILAERAAAERQALATASPIVE
jgi:Kef-type K+ transport system membrane component KefB